MQGVATEKFPEGFEWAFALPLFLFPLFVLLPATEISVVDYRQRVVIT